MTGGTVIDREGRRLAQAGAVAAVLLMGWLAAPGTAKAGTSFELVDIGDFNSPVHVDNAPGAAGHLYVVEKPGTISVLVNEAEQQPFLDIDELVTSGGEEGLLSVAF